MPAPVGPVTYSTPTATTPATTAQDKTASDKNMFLNLMVAQLKYQNPLEPTNGAEFMAQTAQFSQLEALQTLTKQQEDNSRWTRMQLAQSLVDGRVEVTDPATGYAAEAKVIGVKATDVGPLLVIEDATATHEVPIEYVTKILPRDTTAPVTPTTPETPAP